MVEDSPEFYPDEYFVGFDGSKLAGDGYTALAHLNADGTVTVVGVDAFKGPDGEELYASHEWGLNGWDALTLRIWAAQRQALAVFDQLEDYWGPWIAALPADGLFDWMGWRPWELMRKWDPHWPPLQQFPRVWGCDAGRRGVWIPPLIPGLDCSLGPNAALIFDTEQPLEDRSRWTLPDYAFARPHMTNDEFRQLLADTIKDDNLTIEWPQPRQQAEPTHLEIAPYRPEQP